MVHPDKEYHVDVKIKQSFVWENFHLIFLSANADNRAVCIYTLTFTRK